MAKPLVLVTGATGYIASRLIPRLLAMGYRVRCLARDSRRLQTRSWFPGVEAVDGDVTVPTTLNSALEGVHTAYYLIHNMSSGKGYISHERSGAYNFAAAAEQAGLEHIIYLGGLVDSRKKAPAHLQSRIETGETLRSRKVPVTEFRAGAIIGPGSISFEMIRFMTELLPIVIGPTWLKNKSQPIAAQNIIDYLIAALENHAGQGQIFEIGGPEVTIYADLMMRYARQRGLNRRLVMLPGIPLWFMAHGVGLVTPVPISIASPLLDGLQGDSLVRDDSARGVFSSIKLIGYDQAVKDALDQLRPSHLEPVWDIGKRPLTNMKHEGFFISHQRARVDDTPEMVSVKIRKFVRNSFYLRFLTPETFTKNQISLSYHNKAWLEWRITAADKHTNLVQTFFFPPHGLPGFIYWFLLYPLQRLIFKHLSLILHHGRE